MKKSAGKLKLYLAQYRELSAFAQFGSDLDSETKKELDRGKRIVELLKQPQYAPVDSAIQVALFYSASKGLLDDIEASKMKEFEEGFSKYLKSNHRGMLDIIKKDKDLKEDTENKLKKSISDFKDIFNSK
jgi:F-type H+-transporting ATPase subunit alpha